MTSATMNAAAAGPRFEDGFAAMGTAWRRWRVARQTRAALSALPDRGLADLGIARGDIDRLAREAAARI